MHTFLHFHQDRHIFYCKLSSWDPISHSTSLVHGLDIVYDLKMAQCIRAETCHHYNYHSSNKLVVLDRVCVLEIHEICNINTSILQV
jgi:hypothetical protein